MARKVLVVEDEASYRMLMERVLKRAGFELSIAGDGEEGRDLLKKERFDAAILDWNLPRMDGGQLARWIRKSPAISRLPILMLTVRNRPEEEIEGFDSGADDYLPKPYSPKELVSRLERLLELKGVRSDES